MSKYGLDTDDGQVNHGKARFIVFGVGGGGGNAVEYMVQEGINGVTFVAANTDRTALDNLTVPHKIQLGSEGLGAGGNPEEGRRYAEEDEDEIRSMLDGYNMVFITAGMGGGTGTGAAPVVARIAKEMGILTVAVVTTPFNFEGKKRMKSAKDGVSQLAELVDAIITIPNEKLLKIYKQISFIDGLKKADDVLLHAVSGLVQIVDTADNVVINTDFRDVRTAMTAKGYAMMGIGRASGDDRARQAAEKAIRSPLLDDIRLENAKGLLVNITAAELMMSEPEEIAEALSSIADLEEGNIFYGYVQDENMGDEIHVTVIATGLTLDDRPKVTIQQAPIKNLQTAPVGHVSALESRQQAQQTEPQSAPQSIQAQAQPQSAPQIKTRIDVNSYLKSQQHNNK
ncbi:cell division protein FtsZ [Moraxella nonliquefaciens]|jgi:cell division protein ftsZ|uniref:Cell division protein FtsZ n=1 Tax=Moraxella nonliquefaciens TaxID=478 RepID=A0A1B8QLZ8_MORNO|nr:cell division protein FtsZ [Moraxella nonliquefaciens]OBX50925.1 cell division protein FtsZ [Moraxella nonliquefaciens]OBX51131.1 cell division protein FtsZ [Moraxella nonliquefaciens]OBX84848.1 cell division protein FtsZ [Moraxella nonliquefaciens]QPT45142.1 cell division protein FtsZ [Moraxella nonliquefaciens]QQC30174.1 cell division protein FtsZ [Moraxella nonliquefaciens]